MLERAVVGFGRFEHELVKEPVGLRDELGSGRDAQVLPGAEFLFSLDEEGAVLELDELREFHRDRVDLVLAAKAKVYAS